MSYLKEKSSSLNKQYGAAIIVALFVVALVAAISAAMIERLRTDIRRTELMLNANATSLYAQGAVAWAIATLNHNFAQQQKGAVVDRTPITSPIDEQNGFTIQSTLYDALGYFNINNLTDQQYQTNFTRLITTTSPDIDANHAKEITEAIIDWVLPTSKNPDRDEFYLKSDPSYRPSHRPMVSISELLLIKGITPKLFAKLAPFVTALPVVTPVNVNNAPPEVLMSLSMTMSVDAARALAAICKRNPFTDAQKFLTFDIVKNNPIDAAKITVLSNYFLLVTNVKLGTQTLKLYTLLERAAAQGSEAQTVVLWQSKGTL